MLLAYAARKKFFVDFLPEQLYITIIGSVPALSGKLKLSTFRL